MDALPAARVKVFPGLGHKPVPWEDPKGVGDVLDGVSGRRVRALVLCLVTIRGNAEVWMLFHR